MKAKEFNEKYKEFLGERHYGLAIDIPVIVDFLDQIFQDLTKIPEFKYFQIKEKFGFARFYAEGISLDMTYKIEEKINKILKEYDKSKIISNKNQ